MTQILIADDHELIREGLRRLVQSTDDLVIAGEAANGPEVLNALRSGVPDVLLLDLSMPGTSGFDLLKRIHGDYPSLPILVLTMHDEEQYALRAIRAGASGYLTKDRASAQLIQAIRKVAAGGPYISVAVADQLAMNAMPGRTHVGTDDLSNRELEVMQLIVSGKTVSTIAASLNVSAKTISTHKSRILGKLRLSSVAELVRYAIENDLVSDPGMAPWEPK